MKVLLIITAILFTGLARAQTSVRPVKFIEDIQVTPGGFSGEQTSVQVKATKKIITENTTTSSTGNTIEKCSALQFKYAQLLDTSVESIKNLKLYNFIDGWMDTRYRYGGTGRDGIDCSAFADTLVNNVYGINLPRTAHEQFDACKKIFRDELQEGDLVFFNTRGGVSHVGIYLGNSYFVHSSIRGVTISSLSEDYYHRKFISGGRFIVPN